MDMLRWIKPEVSTPEHMNIGSDRILPLTHDLEGTFAVHYDHLVLFNTFKNSLNKLSGFSKLRSPTIPDSRYNKHTRSNGKENTAQTAYN